jgi:prepilin-type N-terminal cleavage/methylation domain-containing protein
MRGFTLIQVMVAVAIIGVLARAAVPSYRRHVCQTNAREAAAGLRALTVETQFKNENDRFVTLMPTCTGSGSELCLPYKSVLGTRFTVSATAATTISGGQITAATYAATALGKTGTAAAGAIWQIDQTGTLRDVTGICAGTQ